MKNKNRLASLTLLACLSLLVAACGGGGDTTNPPPPAQTPPPPGTIGPAGGTVTGPNGTQVVIPANALVQNVVIAITQSSAGAPALPNNLTVAGPMYAFTPHGTVFAQPATMTVPFDPALVPQGATLHLYKTNAAQTAWEEVAGATVSGNTIRGSVNGFSHAVPVQIPPVTPSGVVHRVWSFYTLAGDATSWDDEVNGLQLIPGDEGSGVQHGPEDLSRTARLAPNGLVPDLVLDASFFKDSLGNGYATGTIIGEKEGIRYGVDVNSPSGRQNTPSIVGGSSQYKQYQRFRKNAANATLSYTVTLAKFYSVDFMPVAGDGSPYIGTELMLAVGAYPPGGSHFYFSSGIAHLGGQRNHWLSDAHTQSFSWQPFWDESLFTLETAAATIEGPGVHCLGGSGAQFSLNEPRRRTIDLKELAVGAEFTVRVDAQANVTNLKGTPSVYDCQISWAWARTIDPLDASGEGVSFEYTGLTPLDAPDLDSPPVGARVEPLACDTPAPDAGELQFEFPSYDVSESLGAPQSITLTRTGGTRGRVSATFSTSDGTARAGVDYKPQTSTVFFDDGDDATRVVHVGVLGNRIVDGNRTVNLTLSEPGGCAILGTQNTATLRITDEDTQTPPALFDVGGTVTGLVGTGLVIEEVRAGGNATPTADGPFTFSLRTPGGETYDARIRTQPTNPIQSCRVSANATGTVLGNVTNIQVVCDPPPAPTGSLDATFGEGGRVTSDWPRPSAMRLQSDGKIVVLGENGTGFMRFNADGSPDASFGTAGYASFENDGIFRDTHDLAVLSDGKIIAVGGAIDQQRRRMGIARFNTDGSVDTTFGNSGRVVVHPPGLNEFASSIAYAVHVLPDGQMLVVIGHGDDFAVVRLNADGSFDTTFGNVGIATASFGFRLEQSTTMALQSDGKILLAGRVDERDNERVNVGIARFHANGSLDTSYGDAGVKMTDVTGNHGWDEASDIVVLPDDRAAVAVYSRPGTEFVMTLARFAVTGTFEGATTTPVGPRSDYARAIALQTDGKLLVAGAVSSATVNDFGVVRYDGNGPLDPTFGTAGVVTVDFFAANDDAVDVLVQPDGKILALGIARNGSRVGLGLVRINP
jgi:uncharacterized delta-60 repeat protein